MRYLYLKLLIISFLASFLCLSSLAQTATLNGTITDADTKEGLYGATVKVNDKGTVSDLDGNYELQLNEGTYTIEFSYLGYDLITEEITLGVNESRRLDIEMGEQTNMLQTATVTSGKFEKPLGEVTVSMEVLKPQLLESVNTTSVDEVLQKVPGVDIVDDQANIRGGSGWSYGAGSRVLLLIDDIPALQADAGFPNWDDIPIENIEQIEVVKGAASALYGSSAMNGIINIRTAYAKSKPVTKFSTFYGTYLSPKDKTKKWWDSAPFEAGGSIAHRQKFSKLDLVTGAYFLKRESFLKDTRDLYGRFNLATRYRINDKLSVGFNSNFNSGESDSYFYWDVDDTDSTQLGSFIGDTAAFNNSSRFRFNIDPYITYFDENGNRHKIQGRYYNVVVKSNNNQSNNSQLYYGEYQYQKKFDSNLVITTGLVGSATNVQAELYGDTTYTSSNLAAYLQADKKFFDKLNISAGLRFERNKLKGPEFFQGDTIPDQGIATEAKPVFRLGLNYQLSEFTFLRASWGQGYRYPTIAEKFIVTNAGAINIVPNPSLRSETGWSTEIGIKQGFKISNWEGFVDLAAFWSEYQDMMEFTLVLNNFVSSFQSQNVGNTEIKGLDFSIAGRGELLGIPTTLLAGYTFIDPQFKEYDNTGKTMLFNLDVASEGQRNAANSSSDDNFLKYRSRHAIKFDMESKIKKLSIGVAVNYNSNIEAIDRVLELFIAGIEDYRKSDINGFKTLGIRLGYNFTPKIKLSIIGNNILNEEYMVRPGILEAPTNITGRFDWKF